MNYKTLYQTTISTIFSLPMITIPRVFAQGPDTIDIRGQLAESGWQLDLGYIVSAVVTMIMTLGAVALLGYFVRGAYIWLSAGGDKGKVEEARNHFTNGLIGMALLASVFAIYAVVDQFFGIGNVETNGSSTPAYTDTRNTTSCPGHEGTLCGICRVYESGRSADCAL